jgi:hypothetical protein
MLKKKLPPILIILLSLLLSNPLRAQGLLGGEIRWECNSTSSPNTGKYIFYLEVYQACYNDTGANPLLDTVQLLHSNSPAGNRVMTLLPAYPKDLSPVCAADTNLPHTGCGSADSISAFNGAYRLYIYTDTFALNGIPGVNGWMFYWNGGKRNRSTNIPQSQNTGMRLRSIIYPYGSLNLYPCFDNAPSAAEPPVVTTCGGYPFQWYPILRDLDLDSLTCNFAQPLDTNGNALSFYGGHSYLNPLPDTSDHPNNIHAQIHPFNGGINITSFTAGGFFFNEEISSFKCGILVGKTFRESYFQFYDCDTNVSPVMIAPFNNGSSFTDTVYVSTRTQFNIEFTDSQNLSTGMPQEVKFMAYSNMFGNYIPASGNNPPIFDTLYGCQNPPCASLKAAPSKNLPIHDTSLVSTQFSWQTDCGHLNTNAGCGTTTNVYEFYFKYWDDYCPVPAYNFGKITLVVAHSSFAPPVFDSVRVDTATGNTHLYWRKVQNPNNLFCCYDIFESSHRNGPYTFIDSLTNINDTDYIHSISTGATQNHYYYLRSRLISNYQSSPSDTLNNGLTNLEVRDLYNPFLFSGNPVKLQLKNKGSSSIDSIQFRFLQPDSTWVSELWQGQLHGGDSMEFTFATAFQYSVNPSFRLCAYADVVNDLDTNDNHLCLNDSLGNTNLKIIQLTHPYISSLEVWLSIANIGFTSIDSIEFSFNQPDSSIVIDKWKGFLKPGDTIFYKFPQKMKPANNPYYHLCARAKVHFDVDTTDNRTCLSIPINIETAASKGFRLLSVLPNPSNGYSTLRFMMPKAGTVKLDIYDLNGRLMRQIKLRASAGENMQQLDLNAFESGIYFLRMEFEGQRINGKIMLR